MERALKELNPNLKHGSTAFNANSFPPSKDAYSVQQGVFAKEDRESSQVGMFTIVGTQQTFGTTSAPQLQANKCSRVGWLPSGTETTPQQYEGCDATASVPLFCGKKVQCELNLDSLAPHLTSVPCVDVSCSSGFKVMPIMLLEQSKKRSAF